jgi:hypothetical protein
MAQPPLPLLVDVLVAVPLVEPLVLEVPLALVVPLVEVPLVEVPLVEVPLVADVPLDPLPACGSVNVQLGMLHVAPSPAHLQSVFVLHQPSMPIWPVPASTHSWPPSGFAVQLQICVPHAEPGQSMSFVHSAWAERVHPSTDKPIATTEKARPLNFMAQTS